MQIIQFHANIRRNYKMFLLYFPTLNAFSGIDKLHKMKRASNDFLRYQFQNSPWITRCLYIRDTGPQQTYISSTYGALNQFRPNVEPEFQTEDQR